MNKIVYLLFISVFSLDYLYEDVGLISRYVALLPDALSVLVLLIIIMQVSINRQLLIDDKYLILFGLFGVHIVFGIILNQLGAGAIFAGLRTYFRYVPFFLLPMVFPVSDEQMQAQLKLVLLMLLFQLPLVLYQRFVQFKGVGSGDPISGTLSVSGTLSIVLISAISVLIGFYLKNRLALKSVIFLIVALFIPTTLNETKVTLILLPVAVIVPAVLYALKEKRIIELASALTVAVLLLAAFANIYNKAPGEGEERSLGKFLLEGKIETYLYHQEKADAQTGEFEQPGRVDTTLWAIQKLSGDVGTLAFGLGIGNVSKSFSDKFYGEYTKKYAYLAPQLTAFTNLLWEVGVIGAILVLMGCYFVFNDARQLSSLNNVSGALALGWITVTIIYVLCLGYQNLITTNVIGYLFAYFSGCIVARRHFEDNVKSFSHIC